MLPDKIVYLTKHQTILQVQTTNSFKKEKHLI